MSLSVLIQTLLDFERSPGRYPLAKREPAQLFDHCHTVLLLAAGRQVEGLDACGMGGQEQARRAARFFVRTALLRPGADAYTVLGLSRLADTDDVRAHYRLMIRLTHPDFAGGDSEWPVDAASRINLANDVLSSYSRRADLDRAMGEAAAAAGGYRARPTSSTVTAAPPQTLRPPAQREQASALRHAAGVARRFEFTDQLKMLVFAGGALAAAAGLLVLNPSGPDRSLVARKTVTLDDPPVVTAPLAKPQPAFQLASTDDEPAPGAESPREPLTLTRELGLLPSRQRRAETLDLPPSTPVVLRPTPAPAERPPKAVVMVPGALTTEVPVQAAEATAVAPSQSPVAVRVAAPVAAADPLPTMPTPAAPPKAPRLPEVQPWLVRIEQVAQRGLGVPLAMLIHPSKRKTQGTQQFVFDFHDALAGYRVTGLPRTEFDSREVGDQLDVDLRMHFNLEDVHGSSFTRQVGVRARFGKLDDGVALVRMTLIPTPGAR